MKTVSLLRSKAAQVVCASLLLSLLASCELPPREAWRIVRRDGLITYWDREYHPAFAPSRYLAPAGSPRVAGRGTPAPYRVETSSTRYLATHSSPYRPRPQVSDVVRPRIREDRAVVKNEAPKILREPAARTSPAPKTPASPQLSADALPYGTPVAGKPGMVTSPFAGKHQLVDVTGMAAGEAVKDPYSGKLFRVPPIQQVTAEKTEAAAPAPKTPPAGAEEAKPKP